MILFAALAAGACGQAPVRMTATEASEMLALFAAGAAPVDVCTGEGRARLRGAVRSYAEAMLQAGVAWPQPVSVNPENVRSVDAAVQVALAAGVLEQSDFRGALSAPVLRDWPELNRLQEAARVACAETAELNQAAARFVLETARYRWLAQQAEEDPNAAARLERQARLAERAQAQLEMISAQLDAEIAAAGG